MNLFLHAPLAIDDWHFFINHIPENPSHSDACYRIFESQWKEPYLLWMGRQSLCDSLKEALIEALEQFEEGIEPRLYFYKALFLAASGIGEFERCSRKFSVISKLIILGLVFFSFDSNIFKITFEIDAECRKTMLETDRKTLLQLLNKLYEIPKEQFPHLKVAFILGEIDPCNATTTAELLNHFQNSENEFERGLASEAIERLGKGNQTIISALINTLQNTQDGDTYCKSAYTLAVIDPQNRIALDALINIIQESDLWNLRLRAIRGLEVFEKYIQMEKIIPFLIDLIKEEGGNIQEQAAETLGKIDSGNSQAILIFLELAQRAQNEYAQISAIENLIRVDKFNLNNISNLMHLIYTTEDEEIKRRAAECLGNFNEYRHQAISILIDLIEKSHDGDDDTSPFFKSADHKRKFIRWNAVISLGKIGGQSIAALDALVDVIQSTQNPSTQLHAIQALGNLGISNQRSIIALLNFIQNAEENYQYSMAIDSLKLTLTRMQMPEVMKMLREYLSKQSFKNETGKFKYFYSVFWKCVQEMSYPDFNRAWHD